MMISLLQKLFPATTLDHKAQASNRGNLQIDYWKYFRSFPAEANQKFSDLSVWLVCLPLVNWAYWCGGRLFVDRIIENYSSVYSDVQVVLTAIYVFLGLG
ncbi:MAG: hypothetical protein RLZZ511_3425 [Cyanobacteriota bacterium]|jgi:hypothetical protein